MTTDEIRAAFLATLRRIAPEADPATIQPDRPLRDQIDIDSMDLLNLMIGLSETMGIEVPEADYGRMATLNGAVAYLAERAGAAGRAGGRPAGA